MRSEDSWQLIPETQRDWNDVTNTQIPGPVEGQSAPIYISCDSRDEQSPTEAKQSLTKLRQDRPLL